jgi:hypothetical protein
MGSVLHIRVLCPRPSTVRSCLRVRFIFIVQVTQVARSGWWISTGKYKDDAVCKLSALPEGVLHPLLREDVTVFWISG